MESRSALLLFPALCLLAACGRAGEYAAPAPTTVARAPASAPAPAAQEQAATTQPAAAPRAQMPPPEALTDEAITSRIGSALQADPAMKGADVSINTDHGVVVLSGTVKSHEQTGIASAHAQRQDGVMRVENNLRPEFS
jgi:hyperosmotically inducible protein